MKRVWLVSFSVVALLVVNAVTAFAQNWVKSGTGAVKAVEKAAAAVKPVAVPKVKVPAVKLPKASVPVASKIPTAVPHVAVPAAPRINTTAFVPAVPAVNAPTLSKARLQEIETSVMRPMEKLKDIRATVAEKGTSEQYYLFNEELPLSEADLFKYYENRMAHMDKDLSFDKEYEFAFNNFPLLVASHKPYLAKDAEAIVKKAEEILTRYYSYESSTSIKIGEETLPSTQVYVWANKMAAATTMGMFGSATRDNVNALSSAYYEAPAVLKPISQVIIGRALLSMGAVDKLGGFFFTVALNDTLYKDFWQGIQEYATAHNIPFERSYIINNSKGLDVVALPDAVRKILLSRGALNELHLDPSVTATEDWMFIIHNKGKAK